MMIYNITAAFGEASDHFMAVGYLPFLTEEIKTEWRLYKENYCKETAPAQSPSSNLSRRMDAAIARVKQEILEQQEQLKILSKNYDDLSGKTQKLQNVARNLQPIGSVQIEGEPEQVAEKHVMNEQERRRLQTERNLRPIGSVHVEGEPEPVLEKIPPSMKKVSTMIKIQEKALEKAREDLARLEKMKKIKIGTRSIYNLRAGDPELNKQLDKF